MQMLHLETPRKVGLLLALALTLVFAGCAYADEGAASPRTTENQYFAFAFWNLGATQGTYGVPKEDTTPSWVGVEVMDLPSVNLYIDGRSPIDFQWENKTVGGVAYLSAPGDWWIHNTVYESDMRTARLTAWSPDYRGHMSGYWSPDSWGTYPSLN